MDCNSIICALVRLSDPIVHQRSGRVRMYMNSIIEVPKPEPEQESYDRKAAHAFITKFVSAYKP